MKFVVVYINITYVEIEKDYTVFQNDYNASIFIEKISRGFVSFYYIISLVIDYYNDNTISIIALQL